MAGTEHRLGVLLERILLLTQISQAHNINTLVEPFPKTVCAAPVHCNQTVMEYLSLDNPGNLIQLLHYSDADITGA